VTFALFVVKKPYRFDQRLSMVRVLKNSLLKSPRYGGKSSVNRFNVVDASHAGW
jgi:hypothetical protein